MELDARYIACVPNSLLGLERDLETSEREKLVILFRDDELARLAGSRPQHLTFSIERALRQRSKEEILKIAQGMITFLKTAIALQEVPPSEAELEEFIETRQLGLQNSGYLLNLRGLMTAEGGIFMFIDPCTKDIADPLMWVQAIERVENVSDQI